MKSARVLTTWHLARGPQTKEHCLQEIQSVTFISSCLKTSSDFQGQFIIFRKNRHEPYQQWND